MIVRTYDVKCHELALHFLADEHLSPEMLKINADELARHIQQAIEDWLADRGVRR